MKVLVTGSNGMLGQKIIYGLLGDPLCRIPDEVRTKIKKEVQIIAAARGENRLLNKVGYAYESLDITDHDQVKTVFLKYKPDVVINTAAMTNVDACETKQDECWKANVDAVKYMVEVCEKFNTHFIHISTDFVFDGMKGSEYDETDTPNPLHFYAKAKLEGEKVVTASKLKWAIIRTIIVYAVTDDSSRSNLILWVKNNLQQQKKINVIKDQFRAPTLSEDLAQACIMAAMKGASGIYHVSGKETKSILDLAYRVADFWRLDKSFINPVTSEQLNQPARRPPYTGFIIKKAEKELGYMPHSFIEGLEIVDEQLKAKKSP